MMKYYSIYIISYLSIKCFMKEVIEVIIATYINIFNFLFPLNYYEVLRCI